MTTPTEIEVFVRGTRPPWNSYRRAYDWYGMCAGLTYRTILECGGKVPDGPYPSAWAAYLATEIESTDPWKAPPGAVHYWDYTGVASNGQRERWGHVTLDVLGGGTDTLSATGHAHEFWNTSAGLISVAAQTARGMTYMGWSRTYGRRNRLSIVTGGTAGSGGSPLTPKEDTLSAAEVAEIKAHITAEANRTIAETAQRVMTFVIPSYVPGPDTPSLGKLIRALFQDTFTPAQRQAIATGYEPGVKLDRYGKSDKTGNVFALYTGTDGVKYRYRVTDPAEIAAIGADVLVMPQSAIWAYGPEQGGHELETDFAVSHPGESVGYAVSDATGNLFELFRDSNGNQARRLITDPAEKTAHIDAPTMAQADLWAYAPINQ